VRVQDAWRRAIGGRRQPLDLAGCWCHVAGPECPPPMDDRHPKYPTEQNNHLPLRRRPPAPPVPAGSAALVARCSPIIRCPLAQAAGGPSTQRSSTPAAPWAWTGSNHGRPSWARPRLASGGAVRQHALSETLWHDGSRRRCSARPSTFTKERIGQGREFRTPAAVRVLDSRRRRAMAEGGGGADGSSGTPQSS
jgi:hypothetical protein